MVAATGSTEALTQGHVALYARDLRWLRAMAKGLTQAGHTHQQASTPAEMHEWLRRQGFDALVLKVSDEEDARSVAAGLDEARLPPHAILVGAANTLPITVRAGRAGTLRYMPGRTSTRDIVRLVDMSISSGAAREHAQENGDGPHVEEVDLGDAIDRAASTVYGPASRKRQRFHTTVHPKDAYALGNPAKLRRTLATLLKFVVALAPRGAQVSVDAEGRADEWMIRILASAKKPRRSPADLADELKDETQLLTAIARTVREQGGMLWVEVAGPGEVGFCLTLPLSRQTLQSVS